MSAGWLARALGEIGGTPRGAQVCVAFSGGADSTALLSALAAVRIRCRMQLRAVHVNHQLHADAAQWASLARERAAVLGVDCDIVRVDVERRGRSLEAAARAARYDALRSHLAPGEWLLTAHHLDDQLETMLLQLLRGAGPAGLSAMPARSRFGSGWLLRPLLSVPRAALQDWCERRGLAFLEDPSNADARFDRNYLRLQVLPALRQRWPAAAATAARSAAHLAEAQGLLQQRAVRLLAPMRDGLQLQVAPLRRVTPADRRLVIRQWLRERSLPLPDRARLHELTGPLLDARADAQPMVRWDGAEVRRYDGRLFAMAPIAGAPMQPCQWRWQATPVLHLAGAGELELRPDAHGNLDLAALPPVLQLRFREGGERLAGEAGRRPLKDLLQELDVPPWLRARLPLLYADTKLQAVADLWIAPYVRARAACRRRGRLLWRWQQNALPD